MIASIVSFVVVGDYLNCVVSCCRLLPQCCCLLLLVIVSMVLSVVVGDCINGVIYPHIDCGHYISHRRGILPRRS